MQASFISAALIEDVRLINEREGSDGLQRHQVALPQSKWDGKEKDLRKKARVRERLLCGALG